MNATFITIYTYETLGHIHLSSQAHNLPLLHCHTEEWVGRRGPHFVVKDEDIISACFVKHMFRNLPYCHRRLLSPVMHLFRLFILSLTMEKCRPLHLLADIILDKYNFLSNRPAINVSWTEPFNRTPNTNLMRSIKWIFFFILISPLRQMILCRPIFNKWIIDLNWHN